MGQKGRRDGAGCRRDGRMDGAPLGQTNVTDKVWLRNSAYTSDKLRELFKLMRSSTYAAVQSE